MPQPTASDVHVNRPLTNVSIAFAQDARDFVATRVFPNIPVEKQGDLYFTYPKGAFRRNSVKKRAPGDAAPMSGWEVATDSYFAHVYALGHPIPDQIRANADAPLNLDREGAIFLTQQAMINREIDWVTAYFTAGDPGDTWTFDVDGVASGSETAASSFDPTDSANNDVVQWSDYDNSDPLEDVAEGIAQVKQRTGFRANKLTVGHDVWKFLKNHPDIVDRIKYSGQVGPDRPARVTREAVAALMEIDELLVAEASYQTEDEGQSTETNAFIAGKNALLTYSPPTPGIMTPSAGYTFSWRGYLGAGGPEGNTIFEWRDTKRRRDVLEIEMAYDLKVVSADLGYFFGAIVA